MHDTRARAAAASHPGEFSVTALDLAHLRNVGLSAPEVKTISFLAEKGEMLWRPEYAKPESRELIGVLVDKGLVSCERETLTDRVYLRLTDQGRTVAVQLDAMMVAPKMELAST